MARRLEIHHAASPDFVYVHDLASLLKQLERVTAGDVGFRAFMCSDFSQIFGSRIGETNSLLDNRLGFLDDCDARRFGRECCLLASHSIKCDCRVRSHPFGAALAVFRVRDVITESSFDRHFYPANDSDPRLDFSVGRKYGSDEGVLAVACFDLHSDL